MHLAGIRFVTVLTRKLRFFEYFSPILMEVRSGPVQKYEHIYFFDRSQCARCKNEIKTRGLGRSGVPNNKSSPKSVPLDKAPSARMRKFTHFGAFNSLRSHVAPPWCPQCVAFWASLLIYSITPFPLWSSWRLKCYRGVHFGRCCARFFIISHAYAETSRKGFAKHVCVSI